MDTTKSEDVYIPRSLKLDDAGLPLVPQPSDSPLDPLNYPIWLKYLILMQVCLLGFIAWLSAFMVNPAIVTVAAEFNIAPVVATYQATGVIGACAFGPLIYIPIANVYGRRPAYLISTLVGLASAIGSATAPSFGRLVLASLFTGFGPLAAVTLGVGTVVDLFYEHHRGRAMGVFVFFINNGAYLASMIGGYVARAGGWRWCYWVAAILNGTFFLFALALLPETLFDRQECKTEVKMGEVLKKDPDLFDTTSLHSKPYQPSPMSFKTYLRRLWFWDLDRPAWRVIKGKQFGLQFLRMLKYPSVAIPVFYHTVAHTYSTSAPALSFAVLFTRIYHFDPARNGLAAGLSLLLGSALGELCSGPVTDAMMRRAKKSAYLREETVPAELRLRGIWAGAVMVPIGMLIYGFTIHYATTFIAPCIGIAIACFGTQIVTSVCYTYSCGDCYRHRSNDTSMCFNFVRGLFGMPLNFYVIPLGDKIGFQWSYTFFAILTIIAFVPIVVLIFRGERWRKSIGDPPM